MVARKSSSLNLEEAHNYIAAFATLMMNGRPRELSNSRKAALIAVFARKEFGPSKLGFTHERDVIAMAFRPGHEHAGHTRIAVNKKLHNKVRFNRRWSPGYCSYPPKLFMIASRENEIAHGFSDGRLVRIGPVPRGNIERRMQQGQAKLHRATTAAPDLVANLFRPS